MRRFSSQSSSSSSPFSAALKEFHRMHDTKIGLIENDYQDSLRDLFIMPTIVDSQTKSAIELSRVFDVEHGSKDSSNKKNILILGGSGMGKTTLLKCVKNRWAIGQIFQQSFDYVFYLPLQLLLTDEYKSIVQSIEKQPEEKAVDFIYHYLQRVHATSISSSQIIRETMQENELPFTKNDIQNALRSKRTLLLLDQCQQLITLHLRQGSYVDDLMKYLVSDKSPFSVISVSRFIFSQKMLEMKDFDMKMEMKGFKTLDLFRYIEKFLPQREYRDKVVSLKRYIKQNEPLRETIKQIPLNLAILCNLIKEEAFSTINEVEIFKRYFERLENQYKEHKTPEILFCHQQKRVQPLEKLMKLAFQILLQQQRNFSEKSLQKLFSLENDKKLLVEVLKFGILKKESSQTYKFKNQLYIKHLSAMYMASTFKLDFLIEDIETLYSENQSQGRSRSQSQRTHKDVSPCKQQSRNLNSLKRIQQMIHRLRFKKDYRVVLNYLAFLMEGFDSRINCYFYKMALGHIDGVVQLSEIGFYEYVFELVSLIPMGRLSSLKEKIPFLRNIFEHISDNWIKNEKFLQNEAFMKVLNKFHYFDQQISKVNIIPFLNDKKHFKKALRFYVCISKSDPNILETVRLLLTIVNQRQKKLQQSEIIGLKIQIFTTIRQIINKINYNEGLLYQVAEYLMSENTTHSLNLETLVCDILVMIVKIYQAYEGKSMGRIKLYQQILQAIGSKFDIIEKIQGFDFVSLEENFRYLESLINAGFCGTVEDNILQKDMTISKTNEKDLVPSLQVLKLIERFFNKQIVLSNKNRFAFLRLVYSLTKAIHSNFRYSETPRDLTLISQQVKKEMETILDNILKTQEKDLNWGKCIRRIVLIFERLSAMQVFISVEGLNNLLQITEGNEHNTHFLEFLKNIRKTHAIKTLIDFHLSPNRRVHNQIQTVKQLVDFFKQVLPELVDICIKKSLLRLCFKWMKNEQIEEIKNYAFALFVEVTLSLQGHNLRISEEQNSLISTKCQDVNSFLNTYEFQLLIVKWISDSNKSQMNIGWHRFKKICYKEIPSKYHFVSHLSRLFIEPFEMSTSYQNNAFLQLGAVLNQNLEQFQKMRQLKSDQIFEQYYNKIIKQKDKEIHSNMSSIPKVEERNDRMYQMFTALAKMHEEWRNFMIQKGKELIDKRKDMVEGVRLINCALEVQNDQQLYNQYVLEKFIKKLVMRNEIRKQQVTISHVVLKYAQNVEAIKNVMIQIIKQDGVQKKVQSLGLVFQILNHLITQFEIDVGEFPVKQIISILKTKCQYTSPLRIGLDLLTGVFLRYRHLQMSHSIIEEMIKLLECLDVMNQVQLFGKVIEFFRIFELIMPRDEYFTVVYNDKMMNENFVGNILKKCIAYLRMEEKYQSTEIMRQILLFWMVMSKNGDNLINTRRLQHQSQNNQNQIALLIKFIDHKLIETPQSPNDLFFKINKLICKINWFNNSDPKLLKYQILTYPIPPQNPDAEVLQFENVIRQVVDLIVTFETDGTDSLMENVAMYLTTEVATLIDSQECWVFRKLFLKQFEKRFTEMPQKSQLLLYLFSVCQKFVVSEQNWLKIWDRYQKESSYVRKIPLNVVISRDSHREQVLERLKNYFQSENIQNRHYLPIEFCSMIELEAKYPLPNLRKSITQVKQKIQFYVNQTLQRNQNLRLINHQIEQECSDGEYEFGNISKIQMTLKRFIEQFVINRKKKGQVKASQTNIQVPFNSGIFLGKESRFEIYSKICAQEKKYQISSKTKLNLQLQMVKSYLEELTKEILEEGRLDYEKARFLVNMFKKGYNLFIRRSEEIYLDRRKYRIKQGWWILINLLEQAVLERQDGEIFSKNIINGIGLDYFMERSEERNAVKSLLDPNVQISIKKIALSYVKRNSDDASLVFVEKLNIFGDYFFMRWNLSPQGNSDFRMKSFIINDEGKWSSQSLWYIFEDPTDKKFQKSLWFSVTENIPHKQYLHSILKIRKVKLQSNAFDGQRLEAKKICEVIDRELENPRRTQIQQNRLQSLIRENVQEKELPSTLQQQSSKSRLWQLERNNPRLFAYRQIVCWNLNAYLLSMYLGNSGNFTMNTRNGSSEYQNSLSYIAEKGFTEGLRQFFQMVTSEENSQTLIGNIYDIVGVLPVVGNLQTYINKKFKSLIDSYYSHHFNNKMTIIDKLIKQCFVDFNEIFDNASKLAERMMEYRQGKIQQLQGEGNIPVNSHENSISFLGVLKKYNELKSSFKRTIYEDVLGAVIELSYENSKKQLGILALADVSTLLILIFDQHKQISKRKSHTKQYFWEIVFGIMKKHEHDRELQQIKSELLQSNCLEDYFCQIY